MAQVKCDYCGNYIKDTEKNCPSCGAPNQSYVRVADDTPRTIADLQEWYRARHLPPEDVTRFFIGKNVREPRAFGIYRDGENVVVYKNKSDGTRAVRYKGRDEAYGVNEIYMRLKQEILSQKAGNASKAVPVQRPAAQQRSVPQQRSGFKDTMEDIGVALSGCGIGCLSKFGVVFLVLIAMVIAGAIGVAVDERKPQAGYYYLNEKAPLYYYYGESASASAEDEDREWWVSEDGTGNDWRLFGYLKENKFPENIKGKHKQDDYPAAHPELIPVSRSRNYIDCHHGEPTPGYYHYKEGIFYYFSDEYSSKVGREDLSGWYGYDGDWQYICLFDDRDIIPDELWYYPDDIRVADNYSDFLKSKEGREYSVGDFDDSSWMEQYDANYRAWVDANHSEPKTGYYVVNNRPYYYMRDPYGYKYGSGDHSGWYVWGDSGWEYSSYYSNHDKIGDELWYYADENMISSSYSDFFYYADGEPWEATDFSDTWWYQETEAAYDAKYEEDRKESSSSSSDSDSSYDWDSSSDWDSGSTDWDSDW